MIQIYESRRSKSLPTKRSWTKVQKCRHYSRGFCKLGSLCNFRHDQQRKQYCEKPKEIKNMVATAEVIERIERWKIG